MPFSGQTSQDLVGTLIAEDVSAAVGELYPYEAPLLDWLGDSGVRAMNTRHEFIEHAPLPTYIINSTAIASATAVTAIQVNGLGNAVTVGTLLDNESAAPETMQVASIVGANSIVVSRNYDNVGVGSLAAGGSLFVRAYHGLEGADHGGTNTARLGNRLANTVAYIRAELAVSGTQLTYAKAISGDNFDEARARLLQRAPQMLEAEVVRGVLNTTNSLGTSAQTRSMKGLRSWITAINSTVTASSFAANPHLYLGNVWEQVYLNGAGANETWGLIAGRTYFRNMSDLNDTKVYDSNAREEFKRVIRVYTGAFGSCELFLSRNLAATEALLVPRERIKVVPARPWEFQVMAPAGDNQKGLLIGEYTVEVHLASAMARIKS